jgi:hypothetical protein
MHVSWVFVAFSPFCPSFTAIIHVHTRRIVFWLFWFRFFANSARFLTRFIHVAWISVAFTRICPIRAILVAINTSRDSANKHDG